MTEDAKDVHILNLERKIHSLERRLEDTGVLLKSLIQEVEKKPYLCVKCKALIELKR